MVEQTNNGAQPVSLNVNWMKYDVTKDVASQESQVSQPKQLSPIR